MGVHDGSETVFMIGQNMQTTKPSLQTLPTIKLSAFIGSSLKENGIAFTLTDYLELTDWTEGMIADTHHLIVFLKSGKKWVSAID